MSIDKLLFFQLQIQSSPRGVSIWTIKVLECELLIPPLSPSTRTESGDVKHVLWGEREKSLWIFESKRTQDVMPSMFINPIYCQIKDTFQSLLLLRPSSHRRGWCTAQEVPITTAHPCLRVGRRWMMIWGRLSQYSKDPIMQGLSLDFHSKSTHADKGRQAGRQAGKASKVTKPPPTQKRLSCESTDKHALHVYAVSSSI